MRIQGKIGEKEWWVIRRQHREDVKKRFLEFLEKKDKKSLVALMESLWASAVMKNVEKLGVERRILGKGYSPGDVAELLEPILTGDPSAVLSQRVPGFGPASITEIMFCMKPEEYPIFNRKSVTLLKEFGYKEFDLTRLSPEEYMEFKNFIEEVYYEFKVIKDLIESELGIAIPKFDFVDGVAELVYKDELTIDELKDIRRQILSKLVTKEVLDRTIRILHSATEKYVSWIEKGITEENAIEKVTYYTLGVLESSGVINDPQSRKALVAALDSISKLSSHLMDSLKNEL